jgi:hypothetical protein
MISSSRFQRSSEAEVPAHAALRGALRISVGEATFDVYVGIASTGNADHEQPTVRTLDDLHQAAC